METQTYKVTRFGPDGSDRIEVKAEVMRVRDGRLEFSVAGETVSVFAPGSWEAAHMTPPDIPLKRVELTVPIKAWNMGQSHDRDHDSA